MPYIASRMAAVLESGTLALADKARRLRGQGIDVLNFSNRPATPDPVKRAVADALHEPWIAAYSDTAGLPALREAVAHSLASECSLEINPHEEVLVTVGGKEGLFCAVFAIVNPGDEVLVPDPSWVSYDPCISFAGGVTIHVPTDREKGFMLDPARIEAAVTPRTRMIVLNTPHNPTGVILGRTVLEAIADIARRHNLMVISDECYRYFTYGGREHISIASLPGMAERTITVQTTSKIYNMFGWRVGWVTGPAPVIAQMLKIHQHVVACATTLAQVGGLAAVCLPQSVARAIADGYEPSRDIMVTGLSSIAGIRVYRPQGAYFLFPDITGLGMSSVEASNFLLEKAHIMTVPGSAFGPNGEGNIRINFSCPAEEAHEAVRRVRTAVARL